MLNHRTVSYILVLPLMVYLYVLFRRLLRLVCGGLEKRKLSGKLSWNTILAAGLGAAGALPVLDIYSFGAMVALHVAVIGLVWDFFRWLTKTLLYRDESAMQGFKGLREKKQGNRKVITAILPFFLTALIIFYGYLNTQVIIRTEYQVETQKNIRLEGYTVAFLSDLHIGTTMKPEKLERICKKIEENDPDFVILGGDIVDESSSLEEVKQTFRILSEIDSEFGTFYVYGNHDKGFYDSACAFTPEQLEDSIRSCGITILEDETVVLNGELILSGRRDRTEAAHAGVKRASAAKLSGEWKWGTGDKETAGMNAECYHIIVDHQPRGIEQNAAASFDLMLSGHTHGGQIWPVGLITKWTDKGTVNYGQTNIEGMDVIVSSGIAGWKYPVRTGKHCEYVIVHVEKS